MTPSPSLPAPVLPRPQQKRLSERLVLKGALDRRDEGAVAWLSLRWVHRHGVEALSPLMQELTAGDASLKGWWHDHLHATAVPAAAPGPAVAVIDGGSPEGAVDPAAGAFASAPAAGAVASEEAAPVVASAVDSASTTDSTSASVATPSVASVQVAPGFSFAEITLEAEPQEVEEPSTELVLSFADVAGLEPAIPCEGSTSTEPVPNLDVNAGVEAQISPASSDGGDPGIAGEGAASAEPAAQPGVPAQASIEFLGQPLAFDPWLEAPAVSIPLVENPAEQPASRTKPPADDLASNAEPSAIGAGAVLGAESHLTDIPPTESSINEGLLSNQLAARELVGQDGSIEAVAPANETPPSVSTAAPVTDDPGAETLSAAAPVPGDQALDGLAQWPRPVPEFSSDPGTAVPPFIPARPAAAGVFSFGADSVVTAPQPVGPPSGEATAAVPAADPVAVAPAVDLHEVAPAAEPEGAEAPVALVASLPAESSPTQPEAPEPEQAPIWQRPLARVKHLVRVCVEEVVSTFQTMDSDRNTESGSETVSASDNASTSTTSAARGPAQFGDTFQPRGSGQARGSAPASTSPTGQRPPLEPDRPAGPARRSATEIAPELTPQGRTPPLRERAAAAIAGRPAPAPSHPGLASLRSWLPDDSSSEDTRSS
ncbi:hypothetical protein KBZ19_03575 [Synechococcus sp. L2F]|nr:hypothetical protein [Synechococcus sp. L2F]